MKNLQKIINPFLLLLIAAFLRLIPHLPNFTPIGAMGIFGGAYFGKKRSLIAIILVMFLSDYLLLYINPFLPGYLNFSKIYSPFALIHATTIFVYSSLLINVIIGWYIARNRSPKSILSGSILASIQFFTITNFGVWASGYYPHNIAGLIESYVQGLPFFKWTLLGDLFYSTLFFGGYELALKLVNKKSQAVLD